MHLFWMYLCSLLHRSGQERAPSSNLVCLPSELDARPWSLSVLAFRLVPDNGDYSKCVYTGVRLAHGDAEPASSDSIVAIQAYFFTFSPLYDDWLNFVISPMSRMGSNDRPDPCRYRCQPAPDHRPNVRFCSLSTAHVSTLSRLLTFALL